MRPFLYFLPFSFKCDDQLVMRLTAFVNFEIFVRIFFTNMIAEFVDLLLGYSFPVEEGDALNCIKVRLLE